MKTPPQSARPPTNISCPALTVRRPTPVLRNRDITSTVNNSTTPKSQPSISQIVGNEEVSALDILSPFQQSIVPVRNLDRVSVDLGLNITDLNTTNYRDNPNLIEDESLSSRTSISDGDSATSEEDTHLLAPVFAIGNNSFSGLKEASFVYPEQSVASGSQCEVPNQKSRQVVSLGDNLLDPEELGSILEIIQEKLDNSRNESLLPPKVSTTESSGSQGASTLNIATELSTLGNHSGSDGSNRDPVTFCDPIPKATVGLADNDGSPRFVCN